MEFRKGWAEADFGGSSVYVALKNLLGIQTTTGETAWRKGRHRPRIAIRRWSKRMSADEDAQQNVDDQNRWRRKQNQAIQHETSRAKMNQHRRKRTIERRRLEGWVEKQEKATKTTKRRPKRRKADSIPMNSSTTETAENVSVLVFADTSFATVLLLYTPWSVALKK